MSSDQPKTETRFQGVAVSPGIARGRIHVVREEADDVEKYHIQHGEIAAEIGRFETALIQTRVQILEMQQQIAEAIGAKDAGIFEPATTWKFGGLASSMSPPFSASAASGPKSGLIWW
jgi:signal transduction protein with GAF and PtsI domain